MQLAAAPEVDFEVRGAGAAVSLTGRRLEVSETDEEREILLPRAKLAAGYWEMQAQAGPGQFVESIGVPRYGARRVRRPEGSPEWHEVLIESRWPLRVAIVVSSQAGQITGRVVREGKSVAGAPVFLWPVAESARRALRGAQQAQSDTEGRFRFNSLPPGEYRMMASFDVSEVDEEVLEEARAVRVSVGPSRATATELALWVAP